MKVIETFWWIFAFIAVVVLQIGVLDQVKLSGYINPQIIPALFLLSKLSFNKYIHLFLSFLTGLLIDSWYNTGAIYTSALLVISFIPLERLLGLLLTVEPGSIRISTFGLRRFFIYIAVSYVIFFTWLYLIDSMASLKFSKLGLKIVYSTVVSLLIVIPAEILLTTAVDGKGKKRKL